MDREPWKHLIAFDVVIELHEQGLAEHGGLPGLRDEGCVHGAIGAAFQDLMHGGRQWRD